jgi:hypothetical protein
MRHGISPRIVRAIFLVSRRSALIWLNPIGLTGLGSNVGLCSGAGERLVYNIQLL